MHNSIPRLRTKPPSSRPFRVRKVPVDPTPPVGEIENIPTHAATTTLTDGVIAWMLVAEVAADLDPAERTAIYLLLGCDDDYEAIMRMLTIAQRTGIALSTEAMMRLSQWLRGYAGSDGEETLRSLIEGKPV
jgi:hypothetical protein